MRRTWNSRIAAASFAVAVVAAAALLPLQGAGAALVVNSWRVASAASNASWYAATYGDGRFVVVGHGNEVATSTNGVAWSLHSAPAGAWQSVAYGDGRFVALSALDGSLREMTSRDGAHWSASPGPSGEWTGITYGEGRFVAVSAFGQLITSTDGVNWTTTWVRSQFLLDSVTYGDGRFIAVDSADGDALISLNGFNWSFYTISTPGAPWYAVSYGDGIFSAYSPSGDVATSMLGYTWAIHHTSAQQQMNGSAFGCGIFVAAGQAAGGVNELLSSHMAQSWDASQVPTDANANWTAVAFGANTFVAVNTAGHFASRHVAGYCGPSVATPPRDVSGNIESGQVWTYQHPPAEVGGAPVDGYLVSITNGTRTWTCHAPVFYQPNCIIKGLANRAIYEVSTQVHNRFGWSASTDAQWVIPVKTWSLQAVTVAPRVAAGSPVQIQVTGVIANSEGIYPQSPVSVHFGSQVYSCIPSPFGECLITVANPQPGRDEVWASYTGYGVYYRSPTSVTTVYRAN